MIAGSHPKLKPAEVNFKDRAVAMAMMCRTTIKPYAEKDFWELEDLGVAPPRRCGKCKSCKLCTDEGLILSCQEEEEFQMINDSVQVKDGKTFCSFPFK